MTVTATPIFPQTIVNPEAQIQNSDASTIKTLVTGGTNGTKIEMINVFSTDTSSRDIVIYMTISAVNYPITTISIPATSGSTNAIVPVNLLSSSQNPSLPIDNNGNPYIYVANGSTLGVAATTTVTSGKALTFVGQGGNF